VAGKVAGRSQAERRAATRGELLAAAERLIAERGFEAASLSDIASAAGVSKGAVYHYFPSKDELLLALLDLRFEERIDAVARLSDVRRADLPRRIPQEIPFDRRWNLLFLEFVVRAARDSSFRKQLRSRIRRLRAHGAEGVASFLEREGVESDVSSDELTMITAAVGNGLAIEALLNNRSTDDIYVETLGLLLDGLIARSERKR
jgi:AcrR family transcriptional regulator